jgi:macrolide transport system ATP-binding/permease protein
LFGGVGLVLAPVGLYGVVNYSVRTRTKEIGIRMALGASQGGGAAMMARQGLVVVGAGLVIGLCLAFAMSRFTASLLYGITPTDAVTFAGVPALLLCVWLAAVLLPSARAARLEPMLALRYE